jgi:predicted aspartyl protease
MRSTSCGHNDGEDQPGSDLLTLFGPTLLVDIGLDQAYINNPSPAGPHLAMQGIHALVDTGASSSCIDSQLALALNLPIVDQVVVAGISGKSVVNLHLAQIYVPELDFVEFDAFAAVELSAGGQPHGALIGRSFLRHFKMLYDGGTGQVIIGDAEAFANCKVSLTPHH